MHESDHQVSSGGLRLRTCILIQYQKVRTKTKLMAILHIRFIDYVVSISITRQRQSREAQTKSLRSLYGLHK